MMIVPQHTAFRRFEGGFALIETLIAFTIAVVVVATLAYGVSAAFRSDLHAKARQAEIRVAQSRLEAAGIERELTVGAIEGVTDGLRWRQRTTRARPTVVGAVVASREARRPQAELYWVEVAVKSRDGRELRLGAAKVGVAAP